jgi:hypothetical protein
MKPSILNRDFKHPSDGWYQIEVPGEHLNEAAGVMQVVDRTAVENIVNRFNQEADDYRQNHGTPFPGMLIDHEHFKHDPEKETTAYGWLMRLQNRDGVPFGQINWTHTGKPAVDGGDYRFFSTEYDPHDLQVLDRVQKPVRVRPMRLDGLTLTNDPNNKGGAPITNRADAANEESAPSDSFPDFPTPALDKWFQAVSAVRDSASHNARTAIDFYTCWEWAKQQFPELYAAAFGAAEKASPAAVADIPAASAQVASLANRVAKAAHSDLRFGWDFVRENYPKVYNRMLVPAEGVFNRANEGEKPEFIQGKAARLLNRLACVEQASSGMPQSYAWSIVTSGHPALAGLAQGSLTLDEACALDPELKNKLV